MAVIVGEGVRREFRSPLSLAPLDRAIDCLKLAQMGNMESRRMWNTFAEESPGLARVVAASVKKDNDAIAVATRKADKVLSRGEQFVTKSYAPRAKPRKPKKAARAGVVKSAGSPPLDARAAAVRAMVYMDLNDPDPDRRITAAEILRRGLV